MKAQRNKGYTARWTSRQVGQYRTRLADRTLPVTPEAAARYVLGTGRRPWGRDGEARRNAAVDGRDPSALRPLNDSISGDGVPADIDKKEG